MSSMGVVPFCWNGFRPGVFLWGLACAIFNVANFPTVVLLVAMLLTNANTHLKHRTQWFQIAPWFFNATALAACDHDFLIGLNVSDDDLELEGAASDFRLSYVSISCYKVV